MSIATAVREHVRVQSKEAARLYTDLRAAPLPARRRFMKTLTTPDWTQILHVASRQAGTPYGIWQDDPVGFVTDVLRESTWAKPREILGSIPHNDKVAVPSCYASGKTWSASRACLWFALTHAPGEAQVITMAPTWRQVVRLLWSEVRFAHARAGLPGTVDMAQLKMPTASGLEVVVAYGLSAAPWNEAAVQGIHAKKLLLIVDEAGGISHVIGRNLRGMTSTAGSHMLAIGNPPTDDEGSWFEGLCTKVDENGDPMAKVIPISAYDTPSQSGEKAPLCRTCPPGEPHPVTRHLVKAKWIAETINEHGRDSNYCQAKVFARFPRGGPSRALPSAWVDDAADLEEPEGPEYVALSSLGLPDETDPWMVRRGSWIRLGVDVASDGGDEVAISRCVDDLITLQHASSGPINANATDVAGMVLKEILKAEALKNALGTTAKVRVKVDVNGLGWGVYGILLDWGKGPESKHNAEIVRVMVSETTNRDPEVETLRPYRKRDEMWLATRSLIQPRGPEGERKGMLRFRLDLRTLAQLRAPSMSTNSSGMTVIENKASLKKRGLSSPDRGESVLMTVYEPMVGPPRKKARLIST